MTVSPILIIIVAAIMAVWSLIATWMFKRLRRDYDAAIGDAKRWRAFYSSARFKMIGSANIDHGDYPHDKPTIRPGIHAADWIHFGLEVWDNHPAGDDPQGVHGRALLDTYVDHLIEREGHPTCFKSDPGPQDYAERDCQHCPSLDPCGATPAAQEWDPTNGERYRG